MSRISEFRSRHKLAVTIGLWVIALLVTAVCMLWQDQTGPTYPLSGTVKTANGPVSFEFLRSETIGTDLKVLLLEPLPAGLTAQVKYRRYTTAEPWKYLPMKQGTFEFARRGSVTKVQALGAQLPSLKERAGKYEYYVLIDQNPNTNQQLSVTGAKPVLARYKGDVPLWVLAIHILVIFGSMLFAVRTTLEALVDGEYMWMLWTTIVLFVAGAFVLGPIVQWYAFGVFWSGWPFGGDWTDNKVVVELLAWIVALVLNWGQRRNRWVVVGAGLITLAVYFIPHSIFGSEYNYGSGGSKGTSG